MKTNNLSFLLPLTLAITFAQPQSFKVVGNGSATSSKGTQLRYETRLEPASPTEMVNRMGGQCAEQHRPRVFVVRGEAEGVGILQQSLANLSCSLQPVM